MLGPGERLADRPLADLLDHVASREPAPGGGTSAALACALAAGLVEMTAAFSSRDGDGGAADPMEIVGGRAAALRAEALILAERELESYAPVLDALRLRADVPDRAERVARALSEAAEVPLQIARTAAEVAELGIQAAQGGNAHLQGDAVTGVLLAEAASRSAGRLVELNLAQLAHDPRLEEVVRLANRGSAARRRALDDG